jgi:hypothetical protein
MLISDILAQKRKEQGVNDVPKKPKDYITQKVYEYLDGLDGDMQSVLSKAPNRVDISKSGKYTRYEVDGKPFQLEIEGEINKIPISLIVYEDKEGIKDAWYVAQDSNRNRAIFRYLVKDHEVQMT